MSPSQTASRVRRGWAFKVGDRVASRNDFGPLLCDVRRRAEQDPETVFEVVETSSNGQWLLLNDPEGKIVGGCNLGWGKPVAPGIGHTYFRLVGDCGEHCATYSHDAGGWVCARCDEPLPDSSREAVVA